jgi:hypothetical protein
VQAEEARTGEEGERDEEEARVGAAGRGLARQGAEGDADDGDAEDEPEVGRVMFPVDVEIGLEQQERQPSERNRDEERPEDQRRQEDPTHVSNGEA